MWPSWRVILYQVNGKTRFFSCQALYARGRYSKMFIEIDHPAYGRNGNANARDGNTQASCGVPPTISFARPQRYPGRIGSAYQCRHKKGNELVLIPRVESIRIRSIYRIIPDIRIQVQALWIRQACRPHTQWVSLNEASSLRVIMSINGVIKAPVLLVGSEFVFYSFPASSYHFSER